MFNHGFSTGRTLSEHHGGHTISMVTRDKCEHGADLMPGEWRPWCFESSFNWLYKFVDDWTQLRREARFLWREYFECVNIAISNQRPDAPTPRVF